MRGEADTNALVTVNERPAFRLGEYFHGGDYADNTVSNVYHDLEIYAAINPPGTNTPDTVYAVTSQVFVAKTPEQFTYDADGNMTGDGRFTYIWNAENRMVMASNAEVCVTYAYDHRGRMVRKDIQRRGAEPQSIAYTWDDWNIIREAHVSRLASRVTHNIWGLDLDGTLQGAGGVGGLLAVIAPRPMGEGQGEGGTVFLPCYDANGNISEYVSTNGTIAAHYDYSPFGEQLVASGPLAATFTHRFSTKPWCADTGFNEYVYRKYRPDIGRWMSRDTFPGQDELHEALYQMARNNAISSIDLLGYATKTIRTKIKIGERIDSPAPGYLPGHQVIIVKPTYGTYEITFNYNAYCRDGEPFIEDVAVKGNLLWKRDSGSFSLLLIGIGFAYKIETSTSSPPDTVNDGKWIKTILVKWRVYRVGTASFSIGVGPIGIGIIEREANRELLSEGTEELIQECSCDE